MDKLSQEQRLEQTTSVSQQQVQLANMYAMTGQELEEYIERKLEENPVLEEGREDDNSSDEEHSPQDENDTLTNEQDWELGEYASEDDIPAYKLRELQDRNARQEDIPFAASAPTLDEELLSQLRLEGLRDEEEAIAEFIIGNLTPEGYLTRLPEELENDLLFKAGVEVTIQQIESLIERIRGLEPAGIGARDLRDCLLLQIERRGGGELEDLARIILEKYYDDFENKRFERLCTRLKIDSERLDAVYALIARLNPKPGSYDTQDEMRMLHYNPDFLVSLVDGELNVSLIGEREIRPLRINPQYVDMLQEVTRSSDSRRAKETKDFIRQKVSDARWFIDALAQRQNTLRRTMQAIMDHQRAFFLSGEVADLRPMILKDIAEVTGLDISTISRVSSSKSVQTDYGVYPLKYFFNEGITGQDGEEVSTRAIKQALTELIEAEDKRSPLTDEALARMLEEQGYPLARRTVAKYREQLRIPKASLRRSLS